MYDMKLAFDLISDLHLETWSDSFNWEGQATSPICVVAGDVARDHRVLRNTLKHLSDCYAAVFYIDGNDEHRFKLDQLGESYRTVDKAIKGINRLTYLQDNVAVIEGVAILGTNGWWSFDLDPDIDENDSIAWMRSAYLAKHPEAGISEVQIYEAAKIDAAYMSNSVQRLQKHRDVKKIVMVSHTVPKLDLIKHDIDFAGKPMMNVMGNPYLNLALEQDTENKIHTWCFGHYHGNVDRVINGIRYVNNCRGRGDTAFKQSAYYPKRIEIEY